MRSIARVIYKDHRIIQTVCKHIIAQNALASAGVGVGIDESTHLRIVVTGLEIVERGLSVLVVTPTSK